MKQRAKKSEQIRVKYPGITALNFERILEIILGEVAGWDLTNNHAHDKPGLFGPPVAFGGAVEEQGRTMLHVHLIVWLQGWDTYVENVVSTNAKKCNEARRQVCKVIDNYAIMQLIKFDSHDPNREAIKTFDHNCTESNLRKKKCPQIVDKQQLQNLRHRNCKLVGLMLAKCPNCEIQWRNKQLILDFLV